MSARRKLIAELSEDSMGGIATLQDVERAEQLVDAHRAEVLAEAANPANAATIYAVRDCVCNETPHPTWCPASVPTDARIAEIRQGVGDPLTPRELSWIKGAAARHELHVIGARGLHWPLTDDLPGALLLVSQYLAAAVAVIEQAGLAQEESAAPDFFQKGHTYQFRTTSSSLMVTTWTFKVTSVGTPPDGGHPVAFGWRQENDHGWWPSSADDLDGWTVIREAGVS